MNHTFLLIKYRRKRNEHQFEEGEDCEFVNLPCEKRAGKGSRGLEVGTGNVMKCSDSPTICFIHSKLDNLFLDI